MSKLNAEELCTVPLNSAAEIEARVRDLVGRAIIRKLWLFLLDSERRQLPVLMPIDGIPSQAPSTGSLGPFLEAVCQEPTREVVGVLEPPRRFTAHGRGPRMAAVPRGGPHGRGTGLGRDGSQPHDRLPLDSEQRVDVICGVGTVGRDPA